MDSIFMKKYYVKDSVDVYDDTLYLWMKKNLIRDWDWRYSIVNPLSFDIFLFEYKEDAFLFLLVWG